LTRPAEPMLSCIHALLSQVCVMMQDKVDVEIRLSLLDLLQDLIPSININDQSKANYVLYYFEFFFNNVVMEEASSMIGNKGMFFEGERVIERKSHRARPKLSP